MQRGFRAFAGLIIIVGICIIGIIYREDVFMFYSKHYDSNRKNITISNFEYAIPEKNKELNITTNFIAENYEQLLDIYYTITNSGNKRFTFYCDVDYETCLNDIESLSNDTEKLSVINNYVHPYNRFSTIKTLYSSSGKIMIEIDKTYSSNQIIYLNQLIADFIKNNITDNMSDKEKIKIIHDYIVDNTQYDKSHDLKSKTNIYASDTAYGVFANNKGICSGYTDAMSLFLYALDIENFKISNNNHIWNYVILDGNGYHLDVTWDDPITSDGRSEKEYYFFLISTSKLFELSKDEHQFDNSIYGI